MLLSEDEFRKREADGGDWFHHEILVRQSSAQSDAMRTDEERRNSYLVNLIAETEKQPHFTMFIIAKPRQSVQAQALMAILG